MLEMMRVELRVSTFCNPGVVDKSLLGRSVQEPGVREHRELEEDASERA